MVEGGQSRTRPKAWAAEIDAARRRAGLLLEGLAEHVAWRANGALALRWTGDRFAISAARPSGYERPWARRLPGSMQPAPAARPAARDATPRAGDMDADD